MPLPVPSGQSWGLSLGESARGGAGDSSALQLFSSPPRLTGNLFMCLFTRLVSASVRGNLALCPQAPSSELNSPAGQAACSLSHLADFLLPFLFLWPPDWWTRKF